jgi:hypothetical protein
MSFIDEKYILLVSSRLQKFTRKKAGLYNFRCNYCGDSEKQKNKARGYLYQIKNDYNYKCHNCGTSRTLTNFLKDIDNILYDQYIMERYKNGITGRKTNTPEPQFKFKKPSFSKKIFNLPTILELDKSHFAREYLEKRQIPEKSLNDLYYCENFKEWTNTQKLTFKSTQYDEPRIIIPLIKDSQIFGYQGRSLKKSSKVKYITIILDEEQPKIFGWDKIDWDKKVYIVEGPFDSMFLNNSIAMVGADIDYMFFKNKPDVEFVMIYDNERRNKEIVNRIEKTINRGDKVIIWPPDIISKDINELILDGMTENEIMEIIENNTYFGAIAKLKLNQWKRC